MLSYRLADCVIFKKFRQQQNRIDILVRSSSCDPYVRYLQTDNFTIVVRAWQCLEEVLNTSVNGES